MNFLVNMNFDLRAMLDTNKMEWEPSPKSGVWRKVLAREEKESGHATSIVKYDAGSHFSRHLHPRGEEIVVLDGVFSDEHGDYEKGTYLRNPPGSGHSPFSKEGCIILVKLEQFGQDDLLESRINTQTQPWLAGHGGLQVMPLHQFGTESVALVKWPKGENFLPHTHHGGEEIFVLSGEFIDEHGRYPAGSWLRSPHLSQHNPYVEEETIIWVKTGHLLR